LALQSFFWVTLHNNPTQPPLILRGGVEGLRGGCSPYESRKSLEFVDANLKYLKILVKGECPIYPFLTLMDLFFIISPFENDFL
jgi:hypothetical protein